MNFFSFFCSPLPFFFVGSWSNYLKLNLLQCNPWKNSAKRVRDVQPQVVKMGEVNSSDQSVSISGTWSDQNCFGVRTSAAVPGCSVITNMVTWGVLTKDLSPRTLRQTCKVNYPLDQFKSRVRRSTRKTESGAVDTQLRGCSAFNVPPLLPTSD